MLRFGRLPNVPDLSITMITGAASLGARLFAPNDRATQIGWTIRKGYDFPSQSLKQLENWGMTLSVIREDECLSTRGELKYLDSTFASISFKSSRLKG